MGWGKKDDHKDKDKNHWGWWGGWDRDHWGWWGWWGWWGKKDD